MPEKYPFRYTCEFCLGYTPADEYKLPEEGYCEDCKAMSVLYDHRRSMMDGVAVD